jgi:hypothetical protein
MDRYEEFIKNGRNIKKLAATLLPGEARDIWRVILHTKQNDNVEFVWGKDAEKRFPVDIIKLGTTITNEENMELTALREDAFIPDPKDRIYWKLRHERWEGELITEGPLKDVEIPEAYKPFLNN